MGYQKKVIAAMQERHISLYLALFVFSSTMEIFYFRPPLVYALRAASCKIIDKIHWMVQGGSTELGNFRDVGRACDPSFLGPSQSNTKKEKSEKGDG
jgi:hypothetical protein